MGFKFNAIEGVFDMVGDAAVVGGLSSRITNLEETDVLLQIFENISASSGAVTIPTNATILLDRYENGVDAIVTQTDGTVPKDEVATDSNYDPITCSLDSGGNFVLSAEAIAYPISLIYFIKIPAEFLHDIPLTSIINRFENIEAYEVNIDNTENKLVATNMQEAVDELHRFPHQTGATEVTTLADLLPKLVSATSITGFAPTKNGDGTVTFAAGEFILRTDIYDDSPVLNCVIGETTLAFVDNATNYVYGDYNTGTPILASTLVVTSLNLNSQMLLFMVTRLGNTCYIVDGRESLVNPTGKLARKTLGAYGFEHMYGSSVVVEQADRKFYVSEGVFYLVTNMLYHPPFDTATTGTFMSAYRNGSGGFTRTTNTNTQIDNAYYDDGTGTLAAASAGKYLVGGLYLIIDTVPFLLFVYGQGEYDTLTEALAVQEPAQSLLPPEVRQFTNGQLIAKIIVQEGVNSFADIQTPFAKFLYSSKPITHNGLASIQGGTGTERYHLTAAQAAGHITNPMTTAGDIIINNSTPVPARLAVGSAGQFLGVTSGLPAWKAIKPANYITVGAAGCDYTDIQTAINAVKAGASQFNPYVLKLAPQAFVTTSALVMAPFVFLEGSGNQATLIQTVVTTSHVIEGCAGSAIIDCYIGGATGAGGIGVNYECTDDQNPFTVRNCYLGANETHFRINGAVGGAGYLELVGNSIIPYYKNCFVCIGSGNVAKTVLLGASNLVSSHLSGATHVFAQASGVGASLVLSAVSCLDYVPDANSRGISASDGASITCGNVLLGGFGLAVETLNVGAGPRVIGLLELLSNGADLVIAHPSTTGSIQGYMDYNKVTVDPTATGFGMTYSAATGAGSVTLKAILQGDRHDRLIDLSTLVRQSSSLGLSTGGVITDEGGLDIKVTAGDGYIVDSVDNYIKQIYWEEDTFALNANEDVYIYINTNNIILTSTAEVDPKENVLLGRAKTGATDIQFLVIVPLSLEHLANEQEESDRIKFGTIFVSGCVVTENGTTPLRLDVSSGVYYYGSKRIAPSGATPITFDTAYRDGSGGWIYTQNATTMDNVYYDDNSGTLAAIPSGRFAKALLFVTGDGIYEKYGLVYPQATYATLPDAQNAGLPSSPPWAKDSITKIASIYVQEGNANIVLVYDERPRIGYSASSATVVTVHSGLTGLGADDHTQYLLTSGTRSMSNSLNMGGYQITNVGNVDGVDISAHATRHLPNGTDALTVAAPTTALSTNSTNTEGVQNSLARSDHGHSFNTGAPSQIIPDQTNTTGTSGNFAKADHIHNIPAAAPSTDLSATTANAKGAGTYFALNDHSHAISTASAITVGQNTVNATGNSAGLARANHTHLIDNGYLSTGVTASTLALTVTSPFIHYFTGNTEDQVVNLGDCTTYTLGRSYKLINYSNTVISIVNSSATELYRINPRTVHIAICTDISTADGVWKFEIHELAEFQPKRLYLFDDFNAGSTGGNTAGAATVSGTSAAAAYIAPLGGENDGVLQLTTGTTAAGRAQWSYNVVTSSVGKGVMVWKARVLIPTLSDATNTYTFRLGFGDVTTLDNVDGIYFEYDQANATTWRLKTATNSTRTTTATTTTVSAGVWINLRIEVGYTGAVARFYINDVLVGSPTTNIPTGTARALTSAIKIEKTVGTTARLAQIDYTSYERAYTI